MGNPKVLFEQSSFGELGDDGFWTVVVTIKQAYKEGDSDWQERSISVKSIDKNKERA